MTINNSPKSFNWSSLDLALDYVEKHLGTRYIFPVEPGKKFPPKIKDNLAQASNDPAQIAAWAKRFPRCNWGLSNAKSGTLVVDVDTNQAKGKVGQKTYDGLDLAYGWPATEMTTTPSGGFHLTYEGWADESHPAHIMALGENGLGRDIDTPNYVLIPGCRFDDGTEYTSNGAEAVRCPEWIYDEIRKSKSGKRGKIANAGEIVVELDQQANIDAAIDYLINDAEPSIQGNGGDNNLRAAAYFLKDLGISQEMGAQLLDEYFNPRCEPPWDLDDLVKKMAGAYTYANLSKVGGKTVQAEFENDPVPDIKPMGQWDKDKKVYILDPKRTEQQCREREARAVERREAADAGLAPLPTAKRPVVEMWPSRSHETVDATQAVLLRQANKVRNANGGSKIADQIFQRDGKLVRLSRNLHKKQKASGAVVNAETKEVDGVTVDGSYQELNALNIVAVKPAWLTTRLTRSIEFQGPSAGKPGKKPKLVPKDVKPNVINQLIEAGEWNFPALFNTIEAPTLRKDGSILDEPGYDPATGLFLDPGRIKFPKINPNPTVEQGAAAVAYLDLELLSSFPFADPNDDYAGVSKSAAMALMWTAVTRRTFTTAPAFAADSNEPESGKSMLLKAAGALMTGREIAGRPFSQSEEERRKALGTAFVEGRPFLFFDNVDCTIEGASLEMALTSAHFDDRKLGSHEGITAPTNSLIAFSANHLEIGGNGMTTRVLVSRLIPKTTLKQRLQSGAYRHPNLIPWIVAERPKLIAAVLTALRAFVLHGRGSAAPTISRFPDWGNMIGNALIWYGYPDPTRSGDEIRKADPVHEAMRAVLVAWRQSFPEIGQPVTAAMLLASPTVREEVAAATKCRPIDLNGRAVGDYIRKLVGVGLRLPVQADTAPDDKHSKAKRRRLVPTATEAEINVEDLM